MVDLSRHPILWQCYNLTNAIEECGVSVELTNAVTKASELMNSVDKLVGELEAALEDARNWRAEAENRGCRIKIALSDIAHKQQMVRVLLNKVLEYKFSYLELGSPLEVRRALEEIQRQLQEIYWKDKDYE